MYSEDTLVITRVIKMEKKIGSNPFRREALNKLKKLQEKKKEVDNVKKPTTKKRGRQRKKSGRGR